jgi:ribonucleotide reductase beta subunit family protein with ferritin-like domain
MSEPLLTENTGRFVIFPIVYTDIWESFQNHRKAFWVESEIDLVGDLPHWEKLSDSEKHFIIHVIAFFAASDGIVVENLAARFLKEVQIPEARCFYGWQIMAENTHGITYSRLIDIYIKNQSEKTRLFNAIETIPSIKKKGEWAIKWINSQTHFATRLVAFAIVEAVFFSGSFCAIYWLNEKGVMPGLCKSNHFIARDEGMHTDFACLLYTKYIVNKLTDDKIYEIMEDAVNIEIEFITESLPCSLLGMNSDMMKIYIKFVANRLLKQLGHPELYKDVKQPFPFMDRICLDNKENFFEGRVDAYQMTVKEHDKNSNNEINFTADF